MNRRPGVERECSAIAAVFVFLVVVELLNIEEVFLPVVVIVKDSPEGCKTLLTVK